MKKVLLSLALLVFCTSVAQAASLTAGKISIDYTVPDGYVLADDPKYQPIFDMTAQAMAGQAELHAMYVSEETDKAFMSGETTNLSSYFLLTTLPSVPALSKKDFADLTDVMRSNFGDEILDSEELMETINEKVGDASGGQVQVGQMRPLGISAETERSISYMMLMDVQSGEETVDMAGMMSFARVNGTLLCVNQYRIMESPVDVEILRKDALAVLEGLELPDEGR